MRPSLASLDRALPAARRPLVDPATLGIGTAHIGAGHIGAGHFLRGDQAGDGGAAPARPARRGTGGGAIRPDPGGTMNHDHRSLRSFVTRILRAGGANEDEAVTTAEQ